MQRLKNVLWKRAMTHALLAGVAVFSLVGGHANAEGVTGEITVLNWWGGVDSNALVAVQKAFMAKNPGVTFNNVQLTGQGDMRGAIRASLLGGQKADLFINAWPAFRDELAEAGMLRDLTGLWNSAKIGENYSEAFKLLGSGKDGKVFGISFNYGDRSGIFFRPDTLAKVGLSTPPKTWDELIASFEKLNKGGVVPIAMPAQVWAHAEWFESMLVRTAGVEFVTKLAKHEVPWTSPEVKTVLQKWAELIEAGCCGDMKVALATEWDVAADRVLKDGSYAYILIGMWANARAKDQLNLKEGEDYSLFQFPAMGLGHDDTSMVNSDDWNALSGGENPEASDAFLAWYTGSEAANMIAGMGRAPASNKVEIAKIGKVQNIARDAISQTKLQFVLGDLLPGDLVDEYRVQLQRFLQDPTEQTIDSVTAALEAKAAGAY